MFRKKDIYGHLIVRLNNISDEIRTKITTWCSKFLCIIWRISTGRNLVFHGITSFYRAPETRVSIGNDCRFRSSRWSNKAGINRPCMIHTLRCGADIKIGDNCGFSGTVIAAAKQIIIGKNVICGVNVTITDTDWHYVALDKRRDSFAPSEPVVIGDNVWLGMNVIVLKGVTIGSNSVIAACSVVTHNIPDNVVAAGQPAKIVRNLINK